MKNGKRKRGKDKVSNDREGSRGKLQKRYEESSQQQFEQGTRGKQSIQKIKITSDMMLQKGKPL